MSSEETATAATPAAGGGKAALADVEEAMKDVVDPELGINVVDLGLVYGIHWAWCTGSTSMTRTWRPWT